MEKDKKSIVRFVIRAVWVVGTPLIALLILYLSIDPFRAVGNYDNYYDSEEPYGLRPAINKSMVTADAFKRERLNSDYDSFIFGSSISCSWPVEYWLSHLPTHREGMHFDSSGETPMSMKRKVEFLDRSGIKIHNALIILDPIILGLNENSDLMPYADAPEFVDEGFTNLAARMRFHYILFRSFTNLDFIGNYAYAKASGNADANLNGVHIFEYQPIVYNRHLNEESLPLWDDSIARYPQAFYQRHKLIPGAERKLLHCSEPHIDKQREAAFRAIAATFKRHSTNVKVVIGPNIRREVIAPSDLKMFKQIFGCENVYDMGIKMQYVADCDTNFIDNNHYRSHVARAMIDSVYPIKAK